MGQPLPGLEAAVAEDVRQGYVTIDGARRDYGGAIDPVTKEVDTVQTKELRTKMRDAQP